MKGLLEICCGSFEDVKTAWQNGADRVELNSALYLGGLTPSTANLICAKEQCSIPIVTMVRPRGGGFCYSQDEYETMLLDARILLEHGADGIAFGFLTADHAIHRNRTQEMIDLIHSAGKEAVFHRAFGMCMFPSYKFHRTYTPLEKATVSSSFVILLLFIFSFSICFYENTDNA